MIMFAVCELDISGKIVKLKVKSKRLIGIGICKMRKNAKFSKKKTKKKKFLVKYNKLSIES